MDSMEVENRWTIEMTIWENHNLLSFFHFIYFLLFHFIIVIFTFTTRTIPLGSPFLLRFFAVLSFRKDSLSAPLPFLISHFNFPYRNIFNINSQLKQLLLNNMWKRKAPNNTGNSKCNIYSNIRKSLSWRKHPIKVQAK